MKNASRFPGAVFGMVAAASFAWASTGLFKPAPAASQPSAIDSQIAQLGSRFHFRPVLRGAPVEGNAADFYRRAAASMLRGGADVSAAVEEEDAPDMSGFDVWAHVNRESVSRMRKGASCAGSMLNVDYFKGYDARSAEVGRALDVASAAVVEAMLLLERGQSEQAASLLADTALFGQDLSRGGGLVHRAFGCRVEFLALRYLAALVATAPLRGSDLRELHREAAILDAAPHPVLETALSEAALALGEARSLALPERDGGFADVVAFIAIARETAASGSLDLVKTGAIARGRPGSRMLAQIGDFSLVADSAQSATARLRSALRAIIAVRMAALVAGKTPATLESAYAVIGEPIPPAQCCSLRGGEPAVLRSHGDNGDTDARPEPCRFGGSTHPWEWKLEDRKR